MKTIKPSRLSVLTRVLEHDRRPRLVIGVTAAYRLGAERELVSDVEMWPLVAKALEAESGVLDEGTPKVRGEVLVAGSCYPPGGPQRVSFVRVKVGTVDKRLAVIGERAWRAGVPTEPIPFTAMPIDWTRAFGGEGFEPNPQGRGVAPVATPGGMVHPLPNVEDPGALVKAPDDRPEPAGFGGLALTLPQRKSKFGTYGKDWLETRAYGFAEDMDPTIFNLAPPDQWLDGWFRGDESYLVENMHPEHSRIEGKLPPLAVRVFATRRRSDGGVSFKEVAMRLDTLRLFPEHLLGVLIYRGVLDVAEDDAADVSELLLACEDRAAPRSVAHYRAALEARRDREQGALLALAETDVTPPAELGWVGRGFGDAGNQGSRLEFVTQANFERRHAEEIRIARERIVAAGLDPKDFDLDEKPAKPEVDVDDPVALAAFLKKHAEERESRERELADRRKAAEDKARASLAAQGLDYDAEVERVAKENAGPPKFDARRQLEQMRSLLALAREHGQPNVELERQSADPAYLANLLASEARLKESYRMAVHHQRAVEPLSIEASGPFRAELEVAHLNEIGLEDRDFSGVNLTGLALPGIDLTGGFLEAAELRDTDLTGANLSRTVLAHATIVGARLAGARLSHANLGSAVLSEVDLSGARLDDTILEKTRITRTSFRGARFDRTSLLDTEFGEGVDFGEASAELMVFYKLDLRGVRFDRARFCKCAFVECDLRQADLSGVDLSASTIVTCSVDGARFGGATLVGTQFVLGTTLVDADFTGARMPNASLRGLDLRRARFGGAILDGADLSKSDLSGADLRGASARQAMFIASTLDGAKLAGADLLSALLTRARLQGADLSGASLFQADLAKVQLDAATSLDRASLERARMYPRFQPPKPLDDEASDGS